MLVCLSLGALAFCLWMGNVSRKRLYGAVPIEFFAFYFRVMWGKAIGSCHRGGKKNRARAVTLEQSF